MSAGGKVEFDLPATIEGVFEVELEDIGRPDRRDHGEPGLTEATRRDPGGRPRAGRPPGPADPRVAVRLGGVAGPDRLLRRPLGRLAAQPASSSERWRPLGAVALAAAASTRSPRSSPGRSASSCSASSSGRASTGPRRPDRNFSVTFVFVTVWLGVVALSVVFGDVFRAFNPWRAIARAVGGDLRAGRRASRAPPPLAYPERLGRWPAVAGIARLRLARAVYGQAGFQTVGLTPHTVAIATLVYTAYTFVGMTLFGSRALARARRGVLGLLPHVRAAWRRSRSATGASGRRPPLAGAAALGRRGAGLGGAGPADDRRDHLRRRLRGRARGADRERRRLRSSDVGLGPVASLRITNTLFLALSLGLRRRPLLGRASTACTRCAPSIATTRELGAPVRARVHPDRARLPGRPLLQPRRLPGAGAVHLPALRPARRRLGPVRHRRRRDRLRRDRARTRSGTSRSAPWSSVT